MSTAESVAVEVVGFIEQTGGYAEHMTLRDHFAGLAMQAAYTANVDNLGEGWADIVADESYLLADAMLERRKR